jgi:adenylate cyclase
LLARAAAYRRALTYFAGSDAADLIAADGSLYRRTRVLTIFFSDVRGYTTLSEQLEPDALMDLLNAHFRWLDALVERNGGRVSAHIVDAMLAVFEGSRLRPNHAERALRTAVEACLTRAQRRGGADRLEFGIGIHTGEATSGTLGERKREYTVIGDAVNVAARLQQATRDVGVIVLASEAALEAAGPVSTADRFTRLDALQLKGKAEPVPVFTLDGDAGQLG